LDPTVELRWFTAALTSIVTRATINRAPAARTNVHRAPFCFWRKDHPMRVNGRTLRPSTLAERRLLLSLGTDSVRVPRHLNPFAAARRLRRAAQCPCPDHEFARSLVQGRKRLEELPVPSPDLDLPEPTSPHEEVVVVHGRAA
jgi:hypothetical protein